MAEQSSSRFSSLFASFGVDLSTQLADAVDQVSDAIFDKAIRPIIVVVRVAVFSSLIFTLGVAIAALGAIALVRLLTDQAFDGRVWLSDLSLGGGASLLGMALWRLRKGRRFER